MTLGPPAVSPPRGGAPRVVLRVAWVLALLFGFLVAVRMLGGAIALFGEEASARLFEDVSHPLAGLAVGILATVLVQSSSVTTATLVGLVGSGALDVQHAVPMIMGANIGTTVTNTLVSIGHVRRSAEFERGFAAATMHDFFNLCCVLVLFPLEIATGAISRLAERLTDLLTTNQGAAYSSPVKASVKAAYELVLGGLEGLGLQGRALAVAVLLMGLAAVFLCLISVTRNMKVLISGPLERAMNRSLERSGWVGLAVGVVVTVAVQSSSITTSLLVPMCAAGVLTLENAFPITLGANIGTTITALLASLAADSRAGLTIALVHTCFNVAGILVFYPFPRLRHLPLALARALARATSRNPVWLLVYLGGVFFALPFGGWFLFR